MSKKQSKSKLKKIFLYVFIFSFLSISNVNAWLGLVAENGDLLNILKWNEVVQKLNLKIEKINLKEGNNIQLTDSGSNLVISAVPSGGAETPIVETSGTIDLSTNTTTTFFLNGSNFLPSSTVYIPGIDGSIDSVNIISEDKIEITVTAGNTVGIYDIIISNSGSLNTVWPGNGVGLIAIKKGIVGDDTVGRKFSDDTFAESCKKYRTPSNGYVYSGDIGDGIYIIKQGTNPSFQVYCDMTTDGGGWTRLTKYLKSNGSYYVENLGNITNNFTELFYSYKRETSDKYAFKFTKLWTKQCGVEHGNISNITLALKDYVSNIVDGNWGICPRDSTSGDSNDIITEKIIEGDFVNDTCLNGTLHKSDARNYSWDTTTDTYGNTVGNMTHRVSNTTILFGPKGNGSSRCAGSSNSTKNATEVYIFLR